MTRAASRAKGRQQFAREWCAVLSGPAQQPILLGGLSLRSGLERFVWCPSSDLVVGDATKEHLLGLIPYKKLPRKKVHLPERSTRDAYDDRATLEGRSFVNPRY